MSRLRGRRGFTLVELIIALSIVAALLVVAFGGLRVAVASWRRGDDRAEAQQHARSLVLSLARAIGASYPYRGARAEGQEPVLLFRGTSTRVELVTLASPFPSSAPVAFTAVVIEFSEDPQHPGLVVRQRVLPNQDPFTDAAIAVTDELVSSLRLSYLATDGWREEWDAETEGGLPQAIRVALATTPTRGQETLPALTVPLGAVKR